MENNSKTSNVDTDNTNTTENTVVENKADMTASAIDKAVAAAQARKAAKEANGDAPKAPRAEKPAKEKKVKEKTKKAAEAKAEPTAEELAAAKAAKDAAKAEKDAERAAAKAVRETERATKKAERDAERAKKAAEKAATRKPAHMGKVEKAGAKLPVLDEATAAVFGLVTDEGLTEGQMAILGAHLAHFNRVRATLRSAECDLSEGQTVEIVSSDRDARLIGLVGTIAQVRKIRVLVDIPGHARQAYLFASDVAPITEAETESEEPTFLAPEAEDEVPEPVATGTD